MSCDRRYNSIFLYAHNELGGEEKAEFEMHIKSCTACARQLDDLKAVRSKLREVMSGQVIIPDIADAVMSQLPVEAKQPVRRWTWAYAFSSFAVAAAVIMLMLINKPAEVIKHADLDANRHQAVRMQPSKDLTAKQSKVENSQHKTVSVILKKKQMQRVQQPQEKQAKHTNRKTTTPDSLAIATKITHKSDNAGYRNETTVAITIGGREVVSRRTIDVMVPLQPNENTYIAERPSLPIIIARNNESSNKTPIARGN